MDSRVLDIRIASAQDAQNRSRKVFAILTVVSLAFFIASWNLHVSWYRDFALRNVFYDNDVTKVVQERLLQEWVDSQMIAVPLLGVHIGVGDTAILGSIALMVLTLWYVYALRRENHSIAALLRDTPPGTSADGLCVFYGIASNAIFTTVTDNDRPDSTLVPPRQLPSMNRLMRYTLQLLVYLPAAVLSLLILLDLLSIFEIPAATRWPHFPHLWAPGPFPWLKATLMLGVAFLFDLATLSLCRTAHLYERGTSLVLREYWDSLVDLGQAPRLPMRGTPGTLAHHSWDGEHVKA